jgi:hypothetical protein
MNQSALSALTVPPFIHASVAALAFGVFVTALGRVVFRIAGVSLPGTSGWERGFISAGIGVGLLEYLVYLLATFDVMTASVIRGVILAMVLLLLPQLIAVVRDAARQIYLLRGQRIKPDAVIFAALLIAMMALLLARAATIGDLTDDDGYHLAAPKRWLSRGTLTYLATYTNTNAAMGFELIYAIGMATWNAIAAKGFNFAAGVFALGGLWLCALRLNGTLTAGLAVAAVLIVNPLINLPYVFALAYTDLAVCWMAVACILSWLLWTKQRNPVYLLLLALFAGLAGSFKTTALALGLSWIPVLLYTEWRLGASRRRLLLLTIGFGGIAALPVIPWLYRNYAITGNPLFPMLSTLIDTRDWPSEHAINFSRYVRYYTWAVAAGERLTEGSRKAILLASAAAVLCFVGLVARFAERRPLKDILIFSSLSILSSILLTGLVFRYWLPGVMGFALVGAFWASRALPSRAQAMWPASLLLLTAICLQLRQNPSGHLLSRDFRVAVGLTTLDQEYADSPAWKTWGFINSHTPPDARVLMAAFFTTFSASSYGAFWVDRDCYATDSHLQAFIRFDSWPTFLTSVTGERIEFVVISDQQFAARRHGFTFEALENEYPFSRRLVDSYGERIFRADYLSVYRLDLERAVADLSSGR